MEARNILVVVKAQCVLIGHPRHLSTMITFITIALIRRLDLDMEATTMTYFPLFEPLLICTKLDMWLVQDLRIREELTHLTSMDFWVNKEMQSWRS